MRKRFAYMNGKNEDSRILDELYREMGIFIDMDTDIYRFVPKLKKLLSQLKGRNSRSAIGETISRDLAILKKTITHLIKLQSDIGVMSNQKWVND